MFSGIAIDHAHEQIHASVKGDGGAVGLTENPAALRRWMVTGPEMARLIGEFEVLTMKKKKTDFHHHEQTKHAQMTFGRDITSLTAVIEEMGNPFPENSNDLLVLDSRDLADPAVIDTSNLSDKSSMTPTSTSALSTKQSPLQIQSREINYYYCSAGHQCERNQERNYSGYHSIMAVLCSPCCT